MRPCRQCRSPIENQVAVCPQCGVVQDEKARATAAPPVPRPVKPAVPAPPRQAAPAAPARRRRGFVLGFLADLIFPRESESCFILFLLVTLGAVVGGALAGVRGVIAGIAGAVIAIVLVFGLISLLSSSEG